MKQSGETSKGSIPVKKVAKDQKSSQSVPGPSPNPTENPLAGAMIVPLTETTPQKTVKKTAISSQNPATSPFSIKDLSTRFNSSVPFQNYHSLTQYINQNPQDAPAIISYLLTKHIPNEVNCLNDAIFDFAQLMYCPELASAVFGKLRELIQKNHTTCTEVLGAVVIACDALQCQVQEEPKNVELIWLLVVLTRGVIKTNVDLTSVPNSLFVVRALAAVNALLNLLIMRGVSNPQGFATMGDTPYNDLLKFFNELEENLKKHREQHPWPYFLCSRAQQSLKAIQSMRTEIQKHAHKQAAADEIGKAFANGLKGLLELGGATVTLAGAIAGIVAGMGAPAPIIIPAGIAFGIGCFAAGESAKKTVENARKAYAHLHHQKATSLNSFQHAARQSHDFKPFMWADVQLFPAAILTALEAERAKIPTWHEVDKMGIVYYFTEILLQTDAPDDFLKRVKSIFVEVYQNTSKKDAHVHTFILDSFQRLNQHPSYQTVFPTLSLDHYKSGLITQVNNDKEAKKQENRLGGYIQLVQNMDQYRPTMITAISAHKLTEKAWFSWFQNDRILFLIHCRLSALLTQYSSDDLAKPACQAQLIVLRKQFDRPLIGLGLNDRAWTSDWGRACYDKIEQVFLTLHLSSTTTTEQTQPTFARHSSWKIYGEFIHGDKIERIGVRMKIEAFNKVFPTEKERKDVMAQMVTVALQQDLNTKGTSLTEAEKKEFTEMLVKYVDLEVGKEGAVILGNKHLGVGLDLLCSELERSNEEPMESVTPFWCPPLPKVQFSDDAKEILSALKKTCQFEVELVVGRGKPMIRITLKSSEQPIGRAKKSLIKELKENLWKDLAELKGLIDEKESPEGLVIELSGEPSALKAIHAWLCQVAAIQPELKENEISYQCNIM